mmetsp:Transcript_43679/g.70236  ORF Transcript_43679/g.70236 Transcript_43679/m.70236 type:complete len:86 (+) Transcript_43679:2885-3142(+)
MRCSNVQILEERFDALKEKMKRYFESAQTYIQRESLPEIIDEEGAAAAVAPSLVSAEANPLHAGIIEPLANNHRRVTSNTSVLEL